MFKSGSELPEIESIRAECEWDESWMKAQHTARIRLLRHRSMGKRGERQSRALHFVSAFNNGIPIIAVFLLCAIVFIAIRDRWLSGGRSGLLQGTPPAAVVTDGQPQFQGMPYQNVQPQQPPSGITFSPLSVTAIPFVTPAEVATSSPLSPPVRSGFFPTPAFTPPYQEK